MEKSESFLTRWERIIKKTPRAEPRSLTITGPYNKNWSGGKDEEFGGYFFRVRALSLEQYEAWQQAHRDAIESEKALRSSK